ncbi:hypothetical protein PPL_09249 [Heterostelium album PN500]|uniref:Uncharacterized protein n=1 Tax=Heterostelium pallidum (strain ATCC 26659 / Pp 5 / PN500) TaxID=670386 RepID=D3BL17_HETP5|nr:hypothetical protein PPL_09249 [Heterostelium album PN500]EFA77751.1 hypothetical protein PPL_09249 [Heterostelium album PN500]|eukprot:XP_020429879.1 hypothetical protein PPL_09249 [Heterostelium album PN500]
MVFCSLGQNTICSMILKVIPIFEFRYYFFVVRTVYKLFYYLRHHKPYRSNCLNMQLNVLSSSDAYCLINFTLPRQNAFAKFTDKGGALFTSRTP